MRGSEFQDSRKLLLRPLLLSPFFVVSLLLFVTPRESGREKPGKKRKGKERTIFHSFILSLLGGGSSEGGLPCSFLTIRRHFASTLFSPPPPQCIKLILLLSTKRKDLGKGKGEVGGRSASPLLPHSPFASLAPAVFYSPFPRKPALGLRQFLPRLVSVRGSYCS